jgi:hypothetical protein
MMTRTAVLGCLLAACIPFMALNTPPPSPGPQEPNVKGWWGTTAGFGALIGQEWLAGLRSRGWEVIRQDAQYLSVDKIAPIVRELQDAGFRPVLIMTAAQTPYMPRGIDVNMLDAPDPTPGGMEPWLRVSPEAYAAAINAAMPHARARDLRVWAGFVHIGEAQPMNWFRRVFPLLDPDVRICVNRYPPGGASDFNASHLGGREREMRAFKSVIGDRPWCVSEVGWHQGPLKHWYQRAFGGHYHLTDAQIADLARQEAAYWRRHGADMMCWYQVQDEAARCPQHPIMPATWQGGFGLRRPTGWKQVSTLPLQ